MIFGVSTSILNGLDWLFLKKTRSMKMQDGRPATREETERHLALITARLRELETNVESRSDLSERFRQRYREDALNADKAQAFSEAELLLQLAEARHGIQIDEEDLKQRAGA